MEYIPGVGLAFLSFGKVIIKREDGSQSIFETDLSGQVFTGEIAYSPSNPNIIYCYIFKAFKFYMYRSLDAGYNWESVELPWFMADGNNQPHDQTLEIYPYKDGKEVILSGIVRMHIAIIEDSHESQPEFKSIFIGHADYHGSLKYGEEYFVYNDGGIYSVEESELEYYNNPFEFVIVEPRSISNGLATIQSVDLAINESNDILAMGFWHNGTWIMGTDNEYKKIKSGDGFEPAFHPTDPNIIYTSSQENNLGRYHLSTNESEWLSKNARKGPFHTQIFTHHFHPEDLFYVDEGIWFIQDASTCERDDCLPVNSYESEKIIAVRSSPDDTAGNIYLSLKSSLVKLQDPKSSTGEVILNIENPSDLLQTEKIYDFHVVQENGEDVLFVLTGFSAGSEFNLLKLDSEGNLLDQQVIILAEGLSVIRVFVNPHFHDEYILGTSGGLYIGQFGYEYPVPELSLPPVSVEDLEYNKKENTLYVSTYGRGVWKATMRKTEKLNLAAAKLDIYAYPNPTSDLIKVRSDITEDILVFDGQGKRIDKIKVQTQEIQYFSLGQYPNGVYVFYGTISKQAKKVVKVD